MEHLLQTAAWSLLALVFTCALHLLFIRKKRSAGPDDLQSIFPPCPPGSWPIVGHLPFLGSGRPHHVLAQLANAPPPVGLGPIIGLRLGSKRAVVVCDSHLAKEILHTHDKILANRPHFLVADAVFYGYDSSIAFASYNPRWALLRKLCTVQLFTTKRLKDLEYLRYKEVHSLLLSLYEGSHAGSQPVDLGELFCSMMCNSIGRVLHSKTLSEAGGQDYPAMLKVQEHQVAPTIGDFIPWLKFLDMIPRQVMKSVHEKTDKIIEEMISQRRQLWQERKTGEALPQDLLQVLLSRETKSRASSTEEEELLHINEIKGTIMDVMSAGTHTTALTLEWAMAELLRNPHCMRRLRNEIDLVVGTGPDCFVTEEDIVKLPYLEQVIKEVLRLHPALPLLVPRIAREAVKVDKYILPEGTLVLVNVWAIGRDPNVWENPEEFRPERFDGPGRDMDVKGKHYKLLPFGAGRRICPGLRLAMSMVHVTLANLVRAFEWELPDGQDYGEVDMSEKRGITIMRSKPLLAIPKLRFTPSTVCTLPLSY